MKNIQTILNYHNETKHSQRRYARSLGYMDWATQPNPFRNYSNTKKIKLNLSFDNKSLEYSQIFNKNNPQAPLCLESISQFFQFSLGLAAIKEFQGQSWALRCNASSGNLHPTESYILSSSIDNIPSGIHHYNSKEHELELLCETTNLNLPKDTFLVALSSIVWREAWKYGERSYRYTQLDCGHAIKAIEISAKMLGWEIEPINIKDEDLNKLLGFNQLNRFIPEEKEEGHLLLKISKNNISEKINIQHLLKTLEKEYLGKANQLSLNWHKWPILDLISTACEKENLDKNYEIEKSYENNLRHKSYLAKEVILNRRSAQVMNNQDSQITKLQFETILKSIQSNKSNIHLLIFLHNVKNMKEGLYFYLRNEQEKEKIKQLFKEEFIWEKASKNIENLYLLKQGDYKFLAKAISCNQDIASDSSFSLGMISKFEETIKTHGNHKYKELYWNCGEIGQQLYLEACSLNLSATGIGCFLDDIVHEHLGLKNFSYQSLYHFTIGRAILDTRLSSKKPYENRS